MRRTSLLSSNLRSALVPKLDVWRVRALRQFDADRIALTVGLIIFAKLLTQAGGLDSHERIGHGVKRLRTTENLHTDVVALQTVTSPRQSFIDEIFQEPLPALRQVERAAVKDTVQLVTNRLLVGLAPMFALNFPHVPTPNVPRKRQPRHYRGMQLHTVTYYDERA